MPIIIVSNQDLAGKTIKKQLLELGDFEETDQEFEGNMVYEEAKTKVPLITINRRLIEADHINQFFKTDLLIFGSKHKSESERPSLLVHAPGNWAADNSYGGNPFELARASAKIIKQVLRELVTRREAAQLDYEVTCEVTHHGPTNLASPCVFIELGSNETYWQDPRGARVVAETIIKVITEPSRGENLHYGIGFGGPHYASNFNRVQLTTDFAVSHIAPKYVLDDLREDLVIQAIEKTVEEVKYALLDWKGMVKTQREKVTEFLGKTNLEILRIKKVIGASRK